MKSRTLRDYTARLGDLVAVSLRLLQRRLDAVTTTTSITFTVVDIGCGQAVALSQFRRRFLQAISQLRLNLYHSIDVQTIGINSPTSNISHCPRGINMLFCDISSSSSLPIASNSVDLCISVACFPFVRDKLKALDNCIQCLRPGGEMRVKLNQQWKHGGSSDGVSPSMVIGDSYRSYLVGFVDTACVGTNTNTNTNTNNVHTPPQRYKQHTCTFDGSSIVTLVEWLVASFGSGKRLPPRHCPEDRSIWYCPRLVPHQKKITNPEEMPVEVRHYAPRFSTEASTFQVIVNNSTVLQQSTRTNSCERKRTFCDDVILDEERTVACHDHEGGTIYYRSMYKRRRRNGGEGGEGGDEEETEAG